MDEWKTMVDDCEKRESRLDDFERGFIDSIGRQLADGRGLTTKQADRLEEVWNRATSRG